MALAVAALVITPLVVLGSGGSEDRSDREHTGRTGDQISTPTPTVSVSPASPPPLAERVALPSPSKSPSPGSRGTL
ncbi:hypothetical protein SHKM778_83580 [Streptomyces sp. KM77-8]|uniref:Serine/threonine protein kinase n=1 Tax=Streptomyces haneummycinicus TaxID=3074435 RepID=A0AAT9HWN7_9ACTN